MPAPERPSRAVDTSVVVYRLLLRLYPPEFRRDCGPQLTATFADLAADRVRRRGWRALPALWSRAAVDLLQQAGAERWSSWTGRPLSLVAKPLDNVPTPRRLIMSALVHDLRFGARALLRAPWHTLSLVGTLALGMGSAVAIFTVLYGVLLRPLPFPGSDRVVQLCEISPRTSSFCVASPLNVADIGRAARTLDAAGVARTESFTGEDTDGRFSVQGGIASPGFFRALSLTAAAGRLLDDDDLSRSNNQVAVVSHDFWRTRLQGREDAVGRLVRLDGREVRIIGILPADAFVPDLPDIDVWKPLTASIDDVDERSWRGFMAVARARAGVSRPAVQAELESLHRQLVAAYPADNEGWTLQVDGLRERMVRPVQSMLWIFQAAGLLVLVIACANVGGLLLVRGASRDAEFAIRMAIGAGRGRLSRQLLAEGLLISAAGTVLGIAVAAAGTEAFIEVAPASIPRLQDVAVDGAAAAFAAGLGSITTVVFGLVPLGRRFASRPAGALRTHRTGPGMRLQSAFVIVQLALAVTLLFSAGLVLRAFARVSDWDPGFNRAGLVTAWALASPDRFASPDAAVVALTRIREIAASVPGVLSSGLTSAGPLFGGSETGDLRVADRPESDGRPVNWYDVDEGYFQTLGLRPSSGRLITSRDTVSDPPVAVINDTLARQVFGDEDPIGRRVTVDDYASEVVGVVPTLLPVRPNRPPDPEIYWPIRQYKRYAAYLVLRIDGRTTGTEAALRRRLASDAPDVQVFAFQSIDAMFDRVLAGPRFNTWLIGVFALVALVLSGVGLFGTVAYSVSTRTREIGVRMALGATSRGVAARFVARTLRLAGAGAAIGLLLVVPLSRWLAGLLYGLSAADPAALAATLAVCVLISIVAGYLPARRAARVDPVIALRAE